MPSGAGPGVDRLEFHTGLDFGHIDIKGRKAADRKRKMRDRVPIWPLFSECADRLLKKGRQSRRLPDLRRQQGGVTSGLRHCEVEANARRIRLEPRNDGVFLEQATMTTDYVSDNLSVPKLDALFPNMIVGDKEAVTWPYFRKEIDHLWFVDRRNPEVGFINRDEAAILFSNAQLFSGRRGLEIGAWRGMVDRPSSRIGPAIP